MLNSGPTTPNASELNALVTTKKAMRRGWAFLSLIRSEHERRDQGEEPQRQPGISGVAICIHLANAVDKQEWHHARHQGARHRAERTQAARHREKMNPLFGSAVLSHERRFSGVMKVVE